MIGRVAALFTSARRGPPRALRTDPSGRPALEREMLLLEAREAALVSSVRSYLDGHGTYEGGDECLATLARSEHVGLFFKKDYGDVAVAWATLVRFYPTSPYEGEARAWLAS